MSSKPKWAELSNSAKRELIGREIMHATPPMRYYIMDPTDAGYCLDSDNQADMENYLQRSERLTEQGYHVVGLEQWEYYPADMNAALRVVDKVESAGWWWSVETIKGDGFRTSFECASDIFKAFCSTTEGFADATCHAAALACGLVED